MPIVARGAAWQLADAEAEALARDARVRPRSRTRRSWRRRAEPADPVRSRAPDDADGRDAIADDGRRRRSTRSASRSSAPTDGTPPTSRSCAAIPTDDPTAVLAQYTCAGGIWCDASYDAAFAQYAAATDAAARQAAARTMVRRLADGRPEIVLFAPDQLQAFRTDNVTGFLREPSDVRLVVFWPSVAAVRRDACRAAGTGVERAAGPHLRRARRSPGRPPSGSRVS